MNTGKLSCRGLNLSGGTIQARSKTLTVVRKLLDRSAKILTCSFKTPTSFCDLALCRPQALLHNVAHFVHQLAYVTLQVLAQFLVAFAWRL